MKNLEITINWYIDNKEWLRKKEKQNKCTCNWIKWTAWKVIKIFL